MLEESTSIAHREIVVRTEVGAGKAAGLRASIGREVLWPVATIGTPYEYATAVEQGTRPHMPPIAPIQHWARVKLGDEGAAWPVALAIKRRGTRGQWMFREGMKAAKDRIASVVRDARERIIKRLRT